MVAGESLELEASLGDQHLKTIVDTAAGCPGIGKELRLARLCDNVIADLTAGEPEALNRVLPAVIADRSGLHDQVNLPLIVTVVLQSVEGTDVDRCDLLGP